MLLLQTGWACIANLWGSQQQTSYPSNSQKFWLQSDLVRCRARELLNRTTRGLAIDNLKVKWVDSPKPARFLEELQPAHAWTSTPWWKTKPMRAPEDNLWNPELDLKAVRPSTVRSFLRVKLQGSSSNGSKALNAVGLWISSTESPYNQNSSLIVCYPPLPPLPLTAWSSSSLKTSRTPWKI